MMAAFDNIGGTVLTLSYLMKLHQTWWIGLFYCDKPSLTVIAVVNTWIASFEFSAKLPANDKIFSFS